MTPDALRAFEARVQAEFDAGRVRGPVHLSGGNEAELIEIFRDVKREDWVFSTWRNHYHALLHGIDPDWVFEQIVAGRSLSLNSAAHRFYTSAIVGGILPIAVGVAAGIKRRGGSERVWCFVGDMCASIGAFYDAEKFASRNDLPITFVIEDNGMSTNTPTQEAWGNFMPLSKRLYYCYERTAEHIGTKPGASL